MFSSFDGSDGLDINSILKYQSPRAVGLTWSTGTLRPHQFSRTLVYQVDRTQDISLLINLSAYPVKLKQLAPWAYRRKRI